jgi:hypothetical protein
LSDLVWRFWQSFGSVSRFAGFEAQDPGIFRLPAASSQVPLEHRCFEILDRFGLDYKQLDRNLKHIAVLNLDTGI